MSFFRGYGKKGVFDSFRKNAAFICSNPEGDGSDGLCYKLMLCTYFSKHRAAFQPAVSVQELVTKLSSSDKSENSTAIQWPKDRGQIMIYIKTTDNTMTKR